MSFALGNTLFSLAYVIFNPAVAERFFAFGCKSPPEGRNNIAFVLSLSDAGIFTFTLFPLFKEKWFQKNGTFV